MIPEIIERYVETGLVRYVYREFPLPSLHPNAPKASEAAVCAGQQDRYWEMNEKLFETAAEWGAQGVDPAPFLKGYAKELGLDMAAFDECLDSGAAASAVQGDLLVAQSLGLRGTPSFFVNDLQIPFNVPITVDSLGFLIKYLAAGGDQPEVLPAGEDWHVRGNRQTAQVAVVAFTNYASPESAQHALEVLPGLAEMYIDSDTLVYILYPWAESIDSPGGQAALAAECAGEQDKPWEMYTQLFEEQDTWLGADEPRSLFIDYAQDLDLDTDVFEACLDSDAVALRVHEGGALAVLFGIDSAPAYVLNDRQGPRRLSTLEEFVEAIEAVLNQ